MYSRYIQLPEFLVCFGDRCEPIVDAQVITQIYDHQSNLAQAGVLTQSTMLPPAHAAFCRPGLFYTHGAVSPIAHGAAIFDHWSCRTFSHPKVIFSLSVGGNPLPLRFVLAPVVMVFSKLSPRPKLECFVLVVVSGGVVCYGNIYHPT